MERKANEVTPCTEAPLPGPEWGVESVGSKGSAGSARGSPVKSVVYEVEQPSDDEVMPGQVRVSPTLIEAP